MVKKTAQQNRWDSQYLSCQDDTEGHAWIYLPLSDWSESLDFSEEEESSENKIKQQSCINKREKASMHTQRRARTCYPVSTGRLDQKHLKATWGHWCYIQLYKICPLQTTKIHTDCLTYLIFSTWTWPFSYNVNQKWLQHQNKNGFIPPTI